MYVSGTVPDTGLATLTPQRPDGIDGLVVVDKQAGWTSHDVVAKCRSIFGQRRIGHAGTLDPDATGVLLVGLGRVTRLLRFIGDAPKRYTGEVVLGVATSTLDASGQVTGEWDMSELGIDDVRTAARTLTGQILQVPPMVSAVKVGGRRLHALAREGVEVDRVARPVTVNRFDVAMTAERGVVAIDVDCSSGTFVRSLAADLGTALGGGAHLRNLRRVAIGSFHENEAVRLEAVSHESVLSPAEATRDLPRVAVDAETAAAIANGKVLPDNEFDGDGPWAVVDNNRTLLAVYQRFHPGRVKPAVVVPNG